MNNIFKLLTILFLLLMPATPGYCTVKTIQLTDGSILKGKVLSLSNGVYTVETSNLGQVHIDEDKIQSIQNLQDQPTTNQFDPQQIQNMLQGLSTLPPTQEGNQPNPMMLLNQGFLNNPDLLNELQALMQDEEIQQILNDPEFINQVMNFDYKGVEQNANADKLMNNPQMKAFIEKLSVDISVQEQFNP